MAKKTIVVLGGALSGPTAAARARETDPSARVFLLERSPNVSYAACGLAYHISGEVPSLESLNSQKADFFSKVYGIEARTGVEAKSLNASEKILDLGKEKLRYDSLIVATGAESVLPAAQDLSGAVNVARLRTLGDLEIISSALKKGARRIAIIGGGFLGVEAADAFLRRKCKVTLVEKLPAILPAFAPEMSYSAQDALMNKGARIITGAGVRGAKLSGKKVTALILSDGRELAVDLVVVGAGLKPRTALLRQAGAGLQPDGSVAVDGRCLTTLPGVYACGVCVSLPHAVSGRPVWFAQAAQADKTAQVAGTNAAGGEARMGPVLGTAIVRAGDLTLATTGLKPEEAASFAGVHLGVARVHAPARESFYPGADPVTLSVYFHARSGRIIGAQARGALGVDKAIDTLACAIAGGLTVEQLSLLDLAYQPPFSAARAAVNVAGGVAAAQRAGTARAVSASEALAAPDENLFVDVRSDEDRRALSIESAVPIPLPQLRQRLKKLPSKQRLVFISRTGRRAYLAARIAAAEGRATACYLSGGIISWKAEGHPVKVSKK